MVGRVEASPRSTEQGSPTIAERLGNSGSTPLWRIAPVTTLWETQSRNQGAIADIQTRLPGSQRGLKPSFPLLPSLRRGLWCAYLSRISLGWRNDVGLTREHDKAVCSVST
jgi:hypothetical protein